jgi:hypothetical protein
VIFASRGGVGVANKALGETAAPALPGRPAISLAKQQLLLRKETHHQRARLWDLLTPGVARVNEKRRVVSPKKTIKYTIEMEGVEETKMGVKQGRRCRSEHKKPPY